MDRSDIGCKRGDPWNRFYGHQVNACRESFFSNGSIKMKRLRAPTIRLLTGIVLLTTWSHPPGAAQRSMQHRADSKKEYFLFSWISLNAERARYPCSLRGYAQRLQKK
jgi:hypothetical protein